MVERPAPSFDVELTTEVTSPDDTFVSPQTDPLIDRVLHGVRLVEKIGSGASSQVYRGVHLMLGLEYAVKVLLEERLGSIAARRMVREAQILCRLKHENLVNVIDCGLTEEGAPFIIMELISGPTLWELLHKEGPFNVRKAIALTRQIASGVAAIHQSGFVHRDLKPSNVMITGAPNARQVKLLDFGTARRLEDGVGLTKPKSFIGTPRYTAPEQIRAPSSAGPASDLYSLGVMLYELIAGHPPFDGDVNALIPQHFESPPPPLPSAGPLEPLIMSLLAKDPAQRPASAEVVIEAFDEIEQRRVINTPPAPKKDRPPAPRWHLAIVAAIVLVSGGMLLGLSLQPELPEIVVVGPTSENAPPPAAKAAIVNELASPDVILRRLSTLAAELRASRGSMDEVELELFERRYFDLRAGYRKDLDAAAAAKLSEAIAAFERDFAAAGAGRF